MEVKYFALFLLLIFQLSALSLAIHNGNYDTCFNLPLGTIKQTQSFNYTITQGWTTDQAAQLKSGALNTSDFIHVQGWTPYRKPIQFFEVVGWRGQEIISGELKPIKSVLKGSDAPEFGLSDSDLQLAFGNPSQAKLYKVPSGQALLAVRFQATATGTPRVGKWSVLIDLIDDDNIHKLMASYSRKLGRYLKTYNLTPKKVATALNIIPPFVENSIFWTLTASPVKGTVQSVSYQGFLLVIRAGEQFLAGPINDGQPGLIQIKDVVKTRTECTY